MGDENHRPGYYQDENGVWHRDRRRGFDRRTPKTHFSGHDRRRHYRRKTDAAIQEREARMEIEDALNEFAEEHE